MSEIYYYDRFIEEEDKTILRMFEESKRNRIKVKDVIPDIAKELKRTESAIHNRLYKLLKDKAV